MLSKKKVFSSLLIGVIAAAGDEIGARQKNHHLAAVYDNLTHAIIGSLTWVGVITGRISHGTPYFLEILSCGVFSSLIDVDHFLCAKSFNLKDATSLSYRPFMHCTSAAVLVIIFLFLISHFVPCASFSRAVWILLASFLSHHIRDSTRRGFWLWPFGSTAPVPYTLYILSQMLLPYAIAAVMNMTMNPDQSFVPVETMLV